MPVECASALIVPDAVVLLHAAGRAWLLVGLATNRAARFEALSG
jgi:hypothetical protein